MFLSESFFPNLQRPLVQRLGFLITALRIIHHCQVIQSKGQCFILFAFLLPYRQKMLQPLLRLLILTHRPRHLPGWKQIIGIVRRKGNGGGIIAQGLAVIQPVLSQPPALEQSRSRSLTCLCRHPVKKLLGQLGITLRQPLLSLGQLLLGQAAC